MKRWLSLWLLVGWPFTQPTPAQSSLPTLPVFAQMRPDEDYGYLQADSLRNDGYKRLKFWPLNNQRTCYLSLGGEARVDFVRFWNEDWGEGNEGRVAFWLQRYQLHADLHVGPRFRLFGQLRSALEQGRQTGPRPIDEDRLNVQQLFVDYTFRKDSASPGLLIRLGRQEINYGSQRLISVRDGPNLRLFFDGIKAVYKRENWQLDVLAMQTVSVPPGLFDDRRSKQLNLWDVYLVRQGGVSRPNVDAYYFGIYRPGAIFQEGTATETRHTVGLRWWRLDGRFTHDWEGAIQWGNFGGKPIRAWTLSSDIVYALASGRWGRLALGLRSDLISGDQRAGDGRLQTFNPLYPMGGYFGFDPQIGPANLIDLHPYLTLSLNTWLTVGADVISNWRFSTGDGIYRPSGNFRQAGSASDSRRIGTAYLLKAACQFNRFVGLSAGVEWFAVGPFLREVGARESGLFTNVRLQTYW